MKNRTHFYVSRKNALTWLTALCLVCSAVARIALAGGKGTGGALEVWSQIVLPAAASLLYALIILGNGKEMFYKTAIPIWMVGAYYCFVFAGFGFDALIVILYVIALLFLALLYAEIVAGRWTLLWLLYLLPAAPIAALLYLNRGPLLSGDRDVLLRLIPDGLMSLGLFFIAFAVRVHPLGEYHPTWGDRNDGRRVRSLPPMAQVSPYIMVTRNASTNFITDSFEISHAERYVRRKRQEGLANFGLTHVLLACYVRGLCRYPGLNRFLAGQKVYSRGDDIQFCMTIKKEMRADSPDTVIKVHLSPTDTAEDVYNKMNAKVEAVKGTPLDTNFDNTARVLTLIPGIFLKFTVWFLKMLDYFGWLPKFLLEVSPFHGTVFFTSMGSLGIPPIYHHLYDFGNLPVFGAFGCKRRALEVQEDGTIVQRKYIDCKFTMDERIVDGYYYAAFLKHYKRLLAHPEVLDKAPETVTADID